MACARCFKSEVCVTKLPCEVNRWAIRSKGEDGLNLNFVIKFENIAKLHKILKSTIIAGVAQW